ncbi:MAG TPA: DUF5687 family protein [Rhodothermales bacterium]
MLYGRLFRLQWKSLVRSLSPRLRWLALAAVVFVFLYVSGLLIITGIFFDRIAYSIEPRLATTVFLNENLLLLFASLFSIRFFFQKTPRLGIQPYLHLPIRRAHLVIFFQTSSLLSAHNIFPVLFLIPFWAVHVLPVYAFLGSMYWLIGTIGLVIASHYGNIALRTLLTVDIKQFVIVAGSVIAVVILDRIAGGDWTSVMSLTLFTGLLSGTFVFLLWIVSVAAFLFVYSSVLLRSKLNDMAGVSRSFRFGSRAAFSNLRSQVSNLMLLELQLIWRNRRPRTYLLFAFFFGTVYVALLLVDSRVSNNVLMAALAGLFASGIFAVNHGQLMFSWESCYFDGLLARSINPRSMVLSKLLTLQLSCLIFFVISLPLFLGLAPHLLPLHVAFLLYNAGITSVLMVALAVHNRKRIAIEKGGGFFNYEGFALRHWLWFVPTAVPPTLLLFLMRDQLDQGLVLLGAIGAFGILLTGVWSRLFEHIFLRRKYVMAAGFRTYEH